MTKKKKKLTIVKNITPDAKFTDAEVSHERPSISLKYYDSSVKSLADMRGRKELRALDNFIEKINSHDNMDTACKLHTCKKTNLNNKRWDLRKKLANKNISPQTDIIHLRAGDKFRVHGFIIGERFKLVWLDPDHEIDEE